MVAALLFVGRVGNAQEMLKLTTGKWTIDGPGGSYGLLEKTLVPVTDSGEMASGNKVVFTLVCAGPWQYRIPFRPRPLILTTALLAAACFAVLSVVAIRRRQKDALGRAA